MNYASDDQLTAVAQSCEYFDNGGLKASEVSTYGEEVSCELCRHWDGDECDIDVFDEVLTNLDQE